MRFAPQWEHLIGLGLELKGLGEDETEDNTRAVRFAPEVKSASPDGALQGHLISFQALPQTIPPRTRTLVDDGYSVRTRFGFQSYKEESGK